jgi:dephospho-CoA kinase
MIMSGGRVRRIGLTGGIAAGKTAVSDLLAQHGAVVVDSDLLAREVVAPGTPGLSAVVDAFGPGVLDADGSALDRAALGRLVFADPTARRRLEAIVHPLVRQRARDLEAAALPGSVVVHVIPLLVETGQADRFDSVVVVDVPVELQLARLVEGRGLSPGEARARMAAQASRAERLAVADHVVDGGGSLGELAEVVAALWTRLRQDEPMPDDERDRQLTAQISALVEEENRLRTDGADGLSDEDRHAQLRAVAERLDQIWDLLRQRRAREEFGVDPGGAAARPVDEVESYEQ